MSKDKYPSIFSPQMEAIVFIILQIVFATRAVLKIEEYPRIFPSFSWGTFDHVTLLDQSREPKHLMDYNGKYSHIIPALYELHWLPVLARIHFKILLLAFKAIHSLAPAYIY